MAVTERFELSIQFPVCILSRDVVSATHPRHRFSLFDKISNVVGGNYNKKNIFCKRFYKFILKNFTLVKMVITLL